MKRDILNLLNKKVSFPIKNKINEKTVQYYYGDTRNVIENYVDFLNS